MDDIKDVVTKVIDDIAEKNLYSYDKVGRIWQNILTKEELKHTKLLGVKEETLAVCVDSPAWLYQMRMRQQKILKRIKEELSEIKHIRFKIGTIQ